MASYLDARANSGTWIVRIEDLDRPREVAGAAERILGTLQSFGFEWDGQALRQIFEIAYGEGAKSKPHADSGEHHEHADEFFWRGKVANARISYTDAHQAEAWIGNNDLQDAYGKVQKKMAEDAAATLF